MQTTAQRPMGITILAVLAVIGGLLGLLGSFTALSGGASNTTNMLIGIVWLVSSVASLAFGYGAWTLKPWAWTLGVAIQVVTLVLSVVYILTGSPLTSQILNIAIAAIILYYLFTSGVKQAFGKA
jgi:hypothetical protein